MTSYNITGGANGLTAMAEFATYEEAQAHAQAQPRGWGVRAARCGTPQGEHGIAYLSVRLRSDKVNGGRNEAGAARMRRLLASHPYTLGDGLTEDALRGLLG